MNHQTRLWGRIARVATIVGIAAGSTTACGSPPNTPPPEESSSPTATQTIPTITPTETPAPTVPASPIPTETATATATPTERPVEHDLKHEGRIYFYGDELLKGEITINPEYAQTLYENYLKAWWTVQELARYNVASNQDSFIKLCESGRKISNPYFFKSSGRSTGSYGKLIRYSGEVDPSKLMVGVYHGKDRPDVRTALEEGWVFFEDDTLHLGMVRFSTAELPDGTVVPRLDISSNTGDHYYPRFPVWPLDATTINPELIPPGLTLKDVWAGAANQLTNKALDDIASLDLSDNPGLRYSFTMVNIVAWDEFTAKQMEDHFRTISPPFVAR